MQAGTGTNNLTYADFLRIREEMNSLVATTQELSAELEISKETSQRIERVANIINNEIFRIIVVGGFSRGKSSLINALLGEKLLPAKLTPTTALLTFIRYGEVPEAILFYKDERITPKTVPLDQLRDYLIIQRGALTQDDFGNRINTEFDRMEVRYPLPLCQDGIEIIDTPGLEEDETRQKITLSYLDHADAAIVLLSCQQLLTIEEERFIKEELQGRGFNHLFYAINFCDNLESPEDEEDIAARASQKLGEGAKIYLLSAREALEGKSQHDQELLAKSGFQVFEEDLKNFLVNGKGRLKIAAIINMSSLIFKELSELVDVKLNLLNNYQESDFAKLEADFSAKKEQIDEKRTRILRLIGDKGAFISERVSASFARKCREIARNLTTVAQEQQVEGSIWKRKTYKDNTAAVLDQYVRDQFEKWSAQEVVAFVSKEIERLKTTISEDLRAVLKEIDDLKIMLNPEFVPTVDNREDVFERVLAAAGSFFLLGDLGGVVVGGALGMKGLALQIGSVIAAQSLLYIVGLLNPFTAILASAGAAYMLVTMKQDEVKLKMRQEVAEKFKPLLAELPDQFDHEIRKEVFRVIDNFAKAINNGINAMLTDLEEQVITAKKEIALEKEAAISRYKRIRLLVREKEAYLAEVAAVWGEGNVDGGV